MIDWCQEHLLQLLKIPGKFTHFPHSRYLPSTVDLNFTSGNLLLKIQV